jgi:hypothetical protein
VQVVDFLVDVHILVDVHVANTLVDVQVVDISDEEIVEKIFGIVNEAVQVLDEDVVVCLTNHDIALVLGMGFPACRY